MSLNILNSLLWEENIEEKFLEVIRNYPETREVLPILLAVRERFHLVLEMKQKTFMMFHIFLIKIVI